MVISSFSSYAELVEKCGNYIAEGYYTEIKSSLHDESKKRVIILNRGSQSEIKFYITNKKMDKLIPDTHLGVNFKLKLKFISKCWYHCEGSLEEVIRPLEPFDHPKLFTYPRPELISGTETKCEKNSIDN